MTNIGFPLVSSEVETPRRSALPMGISTSLDANGYGGCMALTPDHAARFATATLAHLGRESPSKLDLVLTGPEDAKPPRTPIGSAPCRERGGQSGKNTGGDVTQ